MDENFVSILIYNRKRVHCVVFLDLLDAVQLIFSSLGRSTWQ